MWERRELKQRAKDVLRTSYWKAFVASLVLAIIGGGCSTYTGSGSDGLFSDSGGGVDFELLIPFLIIFGIIMLVVILFGILFGIFVSSPLIVGVQRYFKQAAEGDVNLTYLGYSFATDKYFDIVRTMFWRALLNFLWFLLLIIPGIVKAYAYSMVPYLLADNPNIGYKRAVELSNEMTRGHKFRIFVLDLSFIGWYILGTLALIVGTLFVHPYYNATKAELYLALRREALERGMTSTSELRLAPPPPQTF